MQLLYTCLYFWRAQLTRSRSRILFSFFVSLAYPSLVHRVSYYLIPWNSRNSDTTWCDNGESSNKYFRTLTCQNLRIFFERNTITRMFIVRTKLEIFFFPWNEREYWSKKMLGFWEELRHDLANVMKKYCLFWCSRTVEHYCTFFSLSLFWPIQGHREHLLFPRINIISPYTNFPLGQNYLIR
jgi:hypothetical protein